MKNLKSLRMEQCKTQAEIAAEIGVTRQAFSSWETGTASPSLDTAKAIADALHTTLNQLAGYPEEPLVSELEYELSEGSALTQEQRDWLRSLVRFAIEYEGGGRRER